MQHLTHEFMELAALLKKHLEEEHEKDDWLLTDKETFDYYKQFALANKTSKPAQAIKQPEKPPQAPHSTPYVPPPPLPKIAPKTEVVPRKTQPPAAAIPHGDEKKSAAAKIPYEPHPLPPPFKDDFNDIRKSVMKLFPKQTILDHPPDEPKPPAPEILIILSKESKEAILHSNLAKAIQICLCPAEAIDAESGRIHPLLGSENVRMILGQKKTVEELSRHYPNIKTLAIPSLENPQDKAELWTHLCREYRECIL